MTETKPLRKEMEKIIWSTRHRDFKSIVDGKKSILYAKGGFGTILVPISSIPDADLEEMFESAAKVWERKHRKAGDPKEWHHDENSVYWGPELAFQMRLDGWNAYLNPSSSNAQERLAAKTSRDVLASMTATVSRATTPQKIIQTILWLLNHK